MPSDITDTTTQPDARPLDGTWALASIRGLLWAPWETDTSLFNVDTGETHLISELPAETLRMLGERPWGLAELCEELAKRCETPCDEAWHSKVNTMLLELDALELIERRPAPRG